MVYAAVLRVRELFYLKECRSLQPWSTVMKDLLDGGIRPDSEHYEVYLNPHPTLPGGDHQCLVNTRVEVPEPFGKTGDQLQRNWLAEIGGNSRLFANAIRFLYRHFPNWTLRMIDFGLGGLKDKEHINASYKVYIGSPSFPPAVSSEIGVPVEFSSHAHVEAAAKVIRIAAKCRKDGNVYHSSPISLRFVKRSTASLAMMEGRDTMMMELILFHPTTGGSELLAAYEEALVRWGGRPHWGHLNYLAGRPRGAARVLSPLCRMGAGAWPAQRIQCLQQPLLQARGDREPRSAALTRRLTRCPGHRYASGSCSPGSR